MDTPNNIFKVLINDEKELFVSLDYFLPFKILFSFLENQKVTIEKINSDYDILVEDLNGDFKNVENEFELNSNIIQNVPLTYQIKCIDKKSSRIFVGFYKIRPLKSIDDNQFEKMVSTLLDFDEKIAFDDSSVKKGSLKNSNAKYSYFKSSINNLKENRAIIFASLLEIANSEFLKLKKDISLSKIEHRQNGKTSIKNLNRFGASKKYSCRLYLEHDNPDLNYLKYVLVFSKRKLEIYLKEHEKNANKLIEKKNEYEKFLTSGDIGIQSKYQKEKLINITNKKIESNNENVVFINKILRYLDVALKSDSLSNSIESRFRPSSFNQKNVFKNIEQYLFYPLKNSFLYAPFLFNSFSSPALKTTATLFELFCLTKIIKSIEDCGYSANESYLDDLLKNNEIVFSNDNEQIIKVGYNMSTIDIFDDEDGLCNVYFKHVTPDYYLVFQKGSLIKRLIIIDAKCRKFSEVVRESFKKEKNLNETMREYYSLRYCLKGSTNKSIDCVYFIVPGEDDQVQFQANKSLYVRTISLVDFEDSFYSNMLELISNVS